MSRCAIDGCKVTLLNKPPGINLHPCPISSDLRQRWIMQLENKCSELDWNKSKICSRHFENKYFGRKRRLHEYAIPTLFPTRSKQSYEAMVPRNKVDRMVKSYNKQSQTQIKMDLYNSFSRLKEPANLNEYITDDLNCKPNSPAEVQLWLLVKKQQSYNDKLVEDITRNKHQWEDMKKALDDMKAAKREMDSTLETYKYIVKCLQEKKASLEEQIEILAAVESR